MPIEKPGTPEDSSSLRYGKNLPLGFKGWVPRIMARALEDHITFLEIKTMSGDLRATARYFVTNTESGITPLGRMASIYETLSPLTSSACFTSFHGS